MHRFANSLLAVALAFPHSMAFTKDAPAPAAARDDELAKRLGADERGMRQFVLGGVSRTLLASMTVPLLIAH